LVLERQLLSVSTLSLSVLLTLLLVLRGFGFGGFFFTDDLGFSAQIVMHNHSAAAFYHTDLDVATFNHH
jgi:hypothetical protein